MDGHVKLECYRADLPGSNRAVWVRDDPMNFMLSLLALQLLLVFVITRTLHYLLRPLGQPRVVSEIIGGIILGPSVLGRYETFRNIFFPKRGTPVLETVATFGLMYVIFLFGVKMDPSLVKRSGKKAVVIGFLGHLFSLVITAAACFFASHTLISEAYEESVKLLSIPVAISLSLTSFAVLNPILSELKLLNSELGRIVMSSSMTNDGIGWFMLQVFVVAQARSVSQMTSVWAFVAVVALVVFILCVVRPLAMWVIDRTPPGKPVDEGYILAFLLIVLVVGFCNNLIGTNTFRGALILGLVIPDGPPLGAALTEKIECIVSGLLLPLYYTLTGLHTDFSAIKDQNVWKAMQLVIFLSWVGKLIGTLLPSLYFKIPIRDALSLSLFMTCKGIVDVTTYTLWRTYELVDDQLFTILILSNVVVTALSAPLATWLYQPSRQYTVYKRRTVQHLKPDMELRIVACVQDQSHVPATINILEATHATPDSPLVVFALHLVELVGRASPLFIPHKLARSSSLAHHISESQHIINAFHHHEQRYQGAVTVHPFTTISPYASMHDEVCRLALEKRASIIIVPFHRKRLFAGGGIEASNGLHIMNRNVIRNAPCSVGVLVVAGGGVGALCTISGEFSFHVAVFFFGGGDDREALAIAARMARHPGVRMIVIRFLPSWSIRDNQAETKLDNLLLEEFKRENAYNQRLAYQETLVRDMEEVVGVIRALEHNDYHLLIVGMRHRANSVLSEHLAVWSDCPELGVVGDFLASPDFEAGFSVLVVKQQDRSDDEDGEHTMAGEQVAHGSIRPTPTRTIASVLHMESSQPAHETREA